MKKTNWEAIIIACIVVMGVFGTASVLVPKSSAEKRIINADGSANQYFEPDQASVSIQITRRSDSAEIATNETATVIDSVLKALSALEIDEKDIETTGYQVYQNYIWVNNTQVWTDYTATCTIKVTVKNFDKVGAIVDKSVEAGALINNIDFEISNEKLNDYKAIVMGKAAQDARNKAEAVVISLGQNIGKVVSVSFDYVYNPYRYWTYGVGLENSLDYSGVYKYTPPTEIKPRDLTVSATLSVEFEII